MKIKNVFEVLGNGGQYVLMALQTDEILKYVELVLSILTTLIILGFNIYSWWKKAKADGELSEDEIKEGVKIIEDGTKEIKDHIDKNKK